LLVEALDILQILVKSARTVSREFYLEVCVYIGRTSYGSLGVLRNTLLRINCLHAVYHQTIA